MLAAADLQFCLYAVNGSIASKCKRLEGLQIGQLVAFRREHIVEVHEESGSDDDDY